MHVQKSHHLLKGANQKKSHHLLKGANQKLFLKKFTIKSIFFVIVFDFGKKHLTTFQPIHQSLVLGFIERFNGWAYRKKLKPSFLANSINASAMPSGVNPS